MDLLKYQVNLEKSTFKKLVLYSNENPVPKRAGIHHLK